MHSHATQSTPRPQALTPHIHTCPHNTLIIYGGVNGSSGVSSVGIPSGSGISDFGRVVLAVLIEPSPQYL